jgi:ABC-2 type transport system permease protein
MSAPVAEAAAQPAAPAGGAPVRRTTDRGAFLLVARREFVERARDRSFKISTAVTLAFLVGFILVASLSGGPKRFSVGVVGDESVSSMRLARTAARSLGFSLSTRTYRTSSAATAAVREGDVQAAIVDGEIVVKSTPPQQLVAALQVSIQQAEVRRVLTEEGLSSDQISNALDRPPPTVRSTEPVPPRRSQAASVAFVGVLALYGQLFAYGYWVASGVVEEKASRIIEVLLATIRPAQLLRGKILGIGALGLCQLMLIGATGICVALATGALEFPAGAALAVVYVIAWFLLGFAFYSSLFAVAGALVSRQEDLQATITPLSLVIVVAFILGMQAVANPSSTLAAVASLIPFSAPLAMPSRLVLGQASLATGALSAAVTVAGALLLIPVATRAYSRAVLQSGRVRLRDAFRSERVA